MPDQDPEDNQEAEQGVPLKDRGEYHVPTGETLPEPPTKKKIHPRRPLPLVPVKRPPKADPGGDGPGD